MATRIPNAELGKLALAVKEAVDFAQAGEVMAGYRILTFALRLVRADEANDVEWAAELAEQYERAIVAYAIRFPLG